MTLFHSVRYHQFNIYHRRHQQSKYGKGSHNFEHLSTTDFNTWTQHSAATPLEEQWECIGTGTPFVFQKKLHLSYGLHTGRIYPDEKTTWPAQWDYLKRNGRTGSFNRANTPGIPAGATYSVSSDGVSNFKKSQVTFHPCQNPSVYIDPSGRLRLLANAGSKGIWKSDSIESGWRCLSPAFPPGGDCTFFFRWGEFDYIIGGFKGLWSKPATAPDSAYEDVVAEGLDFYDGSNVPAITQISGGRFVMAAWLPIRGWGGNLLIRELIQFPDGRIGSKWMHELTPQTGAPKILIAKPSETAKLPVDSSSFILLFDIDPVQANPGKFAISFLSENGGPDSCELQIHVNEGRAQFAPASADGFSNLQKSLREGNSPHEAGNYAIENLIGVDRPFKILVLVKWSDKLGGSLINAEIAGKRTMISYRPELTVKHILFRSRRRVTQQRSDRPAQTRLLDESRTVSQYAPRAALQRACSFQRRASAVQMTSKIVNMQLLWIQKSNGAVLGVAGSNLAENPAEISAAHFADISRREALQQHLARNRMEKSSSQSWPSLVGALAHTRGEEICVTADTNVVDAHRVHHLFHACHGIFQRIG